MFEKMEGKINEVCYFLSNLDPNRLSNANLIKVSRQVSFRNSFQMEKREVKYKVKKELQYWNSVTPRAVEQFFQASKAKVSCVFQATTNARAVLPASERSTGSLF